MVDTFAENAAQQSQRQFRSPGVVAAVDEYLRADTTYTRAMGTLLTQAFDTSGDPGGGRAWRILILLATSSDDF